MCVYIYIYIYISTFPSCVNCQCGEKMEPNCARSIQKKSATDILFFIFTTVGVPEGHASNDLRRLRGGAAA